MEFEFKDILSFSVGLTKHFVHKMISFCDNPLSANNLLGKLLLLKMYLIDFYQNVQERSLGGSHSKLSKKFHSKQSPGCEGSRKQNLQKSSCQKTYRQTSKQFGRLKLGFTSSKFVQIK